jgi:hypothetical protein
MIPELNLRDDWAAPDDDLPDYDSKDDDSDCEDKLGSRPLLWPWLVLLGLLTIGVGVVGALTVG